MSCTYSPVTITGYNASPPPDDGSEVAGNVVTWQFHLDKIGSPLKTAVESINTNLVTYSACIASTYLTQTQLDAIYDIGFSAHKNGTGQTGIATATWTKVTFGTEAYDTGDNFASSTFTAPAAGKYFFSAGAQWVTGTQSGTDNLFAIYKNASSYKEIKLESAMSDHDQTMQIAITDEAAENDTYEVYIRHDHGSDRQLRGESRLAWFTGHRLS